MNATRNRPFWDGPIEARIARLEQRLASPAEDRDETALELALRVLEQMRAENIQLAG